ncbi:MAG TPA: S8 family peptidase [Tepidisphaeraceae bacterium]|jgi:subtilisin family serine protease
MSQAPRIENLETRRLFAAVTVNDPQFKAQPDLQSIDIGRAWSKSTGSLNVVVASIDSGLDYTHPDLYANVWINQDELPGYYRKHLKDVDKDGRISFYDLDSRKNRRWMTDFNDNGVIDPYDVLQNTRRGGWGDDDDADANGYTDDIIGWDFADGDNNPYDYVGHGTHTAGTIAAQADNDKNIAGVAQTSLMVVKIFGDDGDGATEQQIADAIRYSADEGARVSNNSWGFTQPTFGGGFPFFAFDEADYSGDLIYQAIEYAGEKGQIFVAAAGNDTEDNDFSFNGSYPASYDLPNIVSVAAVSDDGELSYFSNYGESSVDLAAPGERVLSTWTGGGTRVASGTSMATPHVTGTIALMLARYPKLKIVQVKNDLLASVDVNMSVYSDLVSGGTLNAGEAVYRAAVRRSLALGNDAGTTLAALASRAKAQTAALFSTQPITADVLDEQTA